MLKTKVITDVDKINQLLTHGVAEVISKDNLEKALASGRRLRVKLGIDPTSPNIHIGRAVALWKLRAFQELGHTAVFIVGDFTGLIGDTSDKDTERPMLSEKEIKANLKTYFNQAFKILDKKNTETHYNSEWLSKLGFLELAKIANLFGLHEFESRELIAKRIKAGQRVSLREVLYPLMQGYDSVAIKADVELGGTDQKFNLLAGRHIQEFYQQPPQNIVMTSLLEGLDGRKMSSSWGNAINITDESNEMFGKVMSIKDDFIERYFMLATNVSRETIISVLAKGPRDAKLELAKEIVRLYHGEESAKLAQEYFVNVFSKKDLSATELSEFKIRTNKLSVLELILFRQTAKLISLKSKLEAKRLISQGAVQINGVTKKDFWEVVELKGGETLKIGKAFFRIKII